MTPPAGLLFRVDLVVGVLCLLVLSVLVLAVAIDTTIGLLGGGLVVTVGVIGLYSYLSGARAYLGATGDDSSR